MPILYRVVIAIVPTRSDPNSKSQHYTVLKPQHAEVNKAALTVHGRRNSGNDRQGRFTKFTALL